MARHVRQVAGLDRLDPRRMGVLSEAMQLWIAMAAAASPEGGPDRGGDAAIIALAQRGGAATRQAMKEGGAAAANSCADAIDRFCMAQ